MAEDRVDGGRPGWVSDEVSPFKSRLFDFHCGLMSVIDRGRDEPNTQGHGKPFRSFLVNCETHTLPRYGHLVAEVAPGSVSHLIARSIRGNSTLDAGSGRHHG